MPFHQNPKTEDYPERMGNTREPFAQYAREQAETLRRAIGRDLYLWLEAETDE